MKKALIVVDVQNDFMPTGALPVFDGDQIVPLINELMPKFDLVVATQDWHPANQGSFAVNTPDSRPGEIIELDGLEQMLWSEHCVQNSKGAAFFAGLNIAAINAVFQKGTETMLDSYSGFFDNGHRNSTGLDEYLHKQGIQQLFITGLATDYCVKFTALDAVAAGFETFLIEDVCRGVNIQPGDADKAISEMKQKQVQILIMNALKNSSENTKAKV